MLRTFEGTFGRRYLRTLVPSYLRTSEGTFVRLNQFVVTFFTSRNKFDETKTKTKLLLHTHRYDTAHLTPDHQLLLRFLLAGISGPGGLTTE